MVIDALGLSDHRLSRQPSLKRNQIISLKDAKSLVRQGWAMADLHVHTFYSHDVVPTKDVDPLVLYERAKAKGMNFISFTDHDTMEAYDRIGWTKEGIVTGVEVKILDRKKVGHTVHINVYMLNKKQFEEIERIAREVQDIELVVEYLKAEHLLFIYNHPFWHEPGEKLNSGAIFDLAEVFPVLEYNLGRIRKLNLLILELAAKKNKRVAAGTDSHTGGIGRIFTLARSKDFREFFDSIKRGDRRLVPEDLTFWTLKHEILNRLDMLLDSKKWVMIKDDLKLETGSFLVDKAIRILADGRTKAISMKRVALKFMARVISSSGLVASLYLRQQNLLARRIQRELTLSL